MRSHVLLLLGLMLHMVFCKVFTKLSLVHRYHDDDGQDSALSSVKFSRGLLVSGGATKGKLVQALMLLAINGKLVAWLKVLPK